MARKDAGNTRKTCVVYCRTSSVHQRLDETIGAQIQRCRQIVERHDLEVLESYGDKGWILDDGISGTLLEGRKFAAFLEDLKARRVRVDALVIFSVSRLARIDSVSKDVEKLERSAADASKIEAVLAWAGVEVIDEAGIHSPGSIPFKIAVLMAAEEYRLIRSRTVAGKVRRLSEGSYALGGKPPFGYRIIEDDGKRGHRKLVPCPVEAPRFKQIVQWYIEGGISFAAQQATKRGWETPRADVARKGKKTNWRPSTVHQLLDDLNLYLGEQTIVFDGVPYHITYDPLISHETLALVERRRKEKAYKKRTQFLTTNFLTCKCGSNVFSANSKLAHLHYIRCKAGCGSMEQRRFESYFWLAVVCRLTQIMQSEGEKRTAQDYDKQLRELDEKIKDVNDRIAKLVDLALSGLDKAIFEEKNRELNQEKSSLLAELGRVKAQREEEASKAAKEQTLESKLRGLLTRIAKEELSLDEKRRTISDLLVGNRIVIEWGPRPPGLKIGQAQWARLTFPAFANLPEFTVTIGESFDIWKQMLGDGRVAGIKIDKSASSWGDALDEWIKRVKRGEKVKMEMRLDGTTDIHTDAG